MSPVNDLLADAFDRIREDVHGAVEGLDPDRLAHRVDAQANSIAWLVWHLTRVQDDHIAAAAGTPQVYPDGWSARFGLPFGEDAIGYGHSSAEVAAVRASAADLLGYQDAVHERVRGYVRGLADGDLARVVDEAWDPPVTLAVRLVSVLDDAMQHAGQAAFVRGIVERR
jgi:uncharacterized damage-inducible protein DinB